MVLMMLVMVTMRVVLIMPVIAGDYPDWSKMDVIRLKR